MHLHDLPADLRLHIDGRESFDPAYGTNGIRDSLLFDLGRENRHGIALAESIGGTMRTSSECNQCDRRDESCRAPSLQGEIAFQLPIWITTPPGGELRAVKTSVEHIIRLAQAEKMWK
jgi:hypothetical protein